MILPIHSPTVEWPRLRFAGGAVCEFTADTARPATPSCFLRTLTGDILTNADPTINSALANTYAGNTAISVGTLKAGSITGLSPEPWPTGGSAHQTGAKSHP